MYYVVNVLLVHHLTCARSPSGGIRWPDGMGGTSGWSMRGGGRADGEGTEARTWERRPSWVVVLCAVGTCGNAAGGGGLLAVVRVPYFTPENQGFCRLWLPGRGGRIHSGTTDVSSTRGLLGGGDVEGLFRGPFPFFFLVPASVIALQAQQARGAVTESRHEERDFAAALARCDGAGVSNNPPCYVPSSNLQ